MELIYLYIEKFNGIVKKQEINFSPNFDVKIINKKLIITNKVSYMNELYPKSIKNITMLLGKNGSGKTTILDILGMNRDDRCIQSIKRKGRRRSEIVDSYFILYHIQGDYFGIEIMDEIESKSEIINLFKNNLTNFDFDIINNPFYKIPIGLVIKKDNDSFQVVQHFFYKSPSLGYKTSEQIMVNYISNCYSSRIGTKCKFICTDEKNYETQDYLCKRRYYREPKKEMQYKYICHLNSLKELGFYTDLAIIEISPEFDYALDSRMEDEEIEQWIDNLEDILYIDKSERINLPESSEDDKMDKEIKAKNNKRNLKEIFILDALSSYIIYEFIQGICAMIDNNHTQQKNHGEINIDLSKNNHIEFLNNLKKKEYVQSDSKPLFGGLSNKKKEYKNLIKVINYYKQDKELKDYNKLICISRYLYSRIESEIGLGSDSKYQIAIEDFFNALNLLKESYFDKKNLLIKCNSKIDEGVINLIGIYDKYAYNQYNNLENGFKIKFLNLSQGEANFLDLLSKIFDIATSSKENQLSIILLDEPDQSLHPEWSRQFINLLCNEIEKYEDKNIQIILSTHSPFMTSDIMSEHIYCLENIKGKERNFYNEEDSRIHIYSMNKKKDKIYNTFGANIYEILKDSFIIDKTIGEFSYTKIVKLINSLKEDLKEHSIEYEEFLIDSIGELPLRKKLKEMYMKKKDNCYNLKKILLEQIKTETNKEKLNKIKKFLNGEEI